MESEPKGKHTLALLCSLPHTRDGHTRSCSKDRSLPCHGLEKQAKYNSDLGLVLSPPLSLISFSMTCSWPLV